MNRYTKAGAATAAALVASGALTLYSDGLNGMLSRWEGEGQNVVYADKLAGGLPTVCRGLTPHTVSEPLVVGDYWSPEKCAEIERKIVEQGQIALADCLPETIKQGAFDAASDHGHHFGNPSTCASRAVGLMWDGKWAEACDAFAHAPSGRAVWSYITLPDGSHKFVRGLYNRALDRRRLCLSDLG